MSTNTNDNDIRVINETFIKEYEYKGLHISLTTKTYPILNQIINTSEVILVPSAIKYLNTLLDNQEGVIHWIYKGQTEFVKEYLEIKFYKHTTKKSNITQYIIAFNIYTMKHNEFEILVNHCIDKLLAVYNELK